MGIAFLYGVGGGSGGSGKPEQSKTVELSMGSGNQTVTPDTGYTLSSAIISKPATMIPSNIKQGVVIGGVTGTYQGGGGSQPTLNAPSVSRSSHTLTVTNPSTNGNFASIYNIWDGATLVSSQSTTQYDLLNLDVGSHTQIHATMSGTNFNDSSSSSNISYSIYSITNSLTNMTSSNAATKIGMNENYSTTLIASAGYYLPTDITVTMGGSTPAYTYNSVTGALTISNVTGNIGITASAESTPILDAPTITISTDTLNISDVAEATSYDLYVDGTNTVNIPKA